MIGALILELAREVYRKLVLWLSALMKRQKADSNILVRAIMKTYEGNCRSHFPRTSVFAKTLPH